MFDNQENKERLRVSVSGNGRKSRMRTSHRSYSDLLKTPKGRLKGSKSKQK